MRSSAIALLYFALPHFAFATLIGSVLGGAVASHSSLCHSVAAPYVLCAAIAEQYFTVQRHRVSAQYSALAAPSLSRQCRRFALVRRVSLCLALARLIASIRSNAIALLLETVLCGCSTSHVDALPLQGVTVRD